MFKKNHHHLQIPLTSHVDELPEKLRKRLDTSWAGVFYPEFFCRLPALAQVQVNEAPFGVLYADCPSRPNVPVNVMVVLEYLKAGNGWTDEEMYDAFCYDILYDEKIGGTIHLALGRAYAECGGINQSALHWDIIKDLRQEGQIYLDGRKVFDDGKFLV